MNFAERLMSNQDKISTLQVLPSVDKSTELTYNVKFVKIISRQNTIAVISKDKDVYILAEPSLAERKSPSLSLLPITAKYPLVDVTVSSRNLIVVYSLADSLSLQLLAQNTANLEYEKCQVLKTSDYLKRENTMSSDTRLIGRKSRKKSRHSNHEKLKMPSLRKSSKDSETSHSVVSKSTRRPPKKNKFPSPQLQSNTVSSLKCLGFSDNAITKLKEKIQLSSIIKRKQSRTVKERVKELTKGLGKEAFPITLDTDLRQAAVLLSDYDYHKTPQMSLLAYSQGSQSRAVWMQLVASGRQNDLINYTLKHAIDKPTEHVLYRHLRDHHSKYKLNDEASKQTVEIRGTELLEQAKEGVVMCRRIQDELHSDILHCQKVLDLVVFDNVD